MQTQINLNRPYSEWKGTVHPKIQTHCCSKPLWDSFFCGIQKDILLINELINESD